MKRFSLTLILVCICTFTLSACKESEQVDYGNEYVYEQDAQNFALGTNECIFTEDGFYVIDDDTNIIFIDNATKTVMPLCGKPNCGHNDESCNSHFFQIEKILLYDGHIYIVAHGSGNKMTNVYLYKMSLDGSERTELGTLFSYEEEDVSCSLQFVIHRGYGYMVTNWIQNDRKKQREQILYRISLDDTSERVELHKIKGYSPSIIYTNFIGNTIYFYTTWFTDKDFTNLEEHKLSMNILTDTITEVNIPEGHYIVTVKDGIIYTVKDNDVYSELYCMDEDGNNLKKIYKWDYNEAGVNADEKYIYLDNEFYVLQNDLPYSERVVTAIDYEGNHVFDIDNLEYRGIRWSNSEYLLIRDVQNEECRYSLFDLSTQEEIPLKGYTSND